MRTYGRITNSSGARQWVEVKTDANGYNDDVYLTTLIQVLQLSLGESPFYATYGLPQVQMVQLQQQPDYWLALTQAQFAPYFASLTISATPYTDADGFSRPAYAIKVITNQGSTISVTVAK